MWNRTDAMFGSLRKSSQLSAGSLVFENVDSQTTCDDIGNGNKGTELGNSYQPKAAISLILVWLCRIV